MGADFFTLHKIPDLTLAQYSAQESGGVDDVIRQHASFYRQINRKGLLFEEVYHLIYLFHPSGQPGKRLSVYLRADRDNEPVCMQEFMDASPLSAYFQYKREAPQINPVFTYQATLAKQDGMVSSSNPERENEYYVVNSWKANEKARLMGLFRMMQKLNRPVAYVVTMKPVELSEEMRESFRFQIQYIQNLEKQNKGSRDENAQQCLRVYDKLLENLRSNPHFLCQISAYAQSEALAKMILDAAASEAVEEGNYRIVCKKGKYQPLIPEVDIPELCINEAPRGMRRWNSLFFLKELVPFAMFPVLYPGENIEIPKESAPVYEDTGLSLGKDNSGYQVYLPLKLLTKHALLTGVPGSGKTYSMLHLSSSLAGEENNIPILVLEPAKKEYRALAHNEKIPDLLVFSPGATGSFPLRINPFEFPIGTLLAEHIANLNQVFAGAFDLTPPMPFLLSEAIDKVYRDHGWYSFEVNDGTHSYPSIRELYDVIESLLEVYQYPAEIENNLKSCLQVRIGSLVRMQMGNVFDVPQSTFKPEEWIQKKCIIELESLGEDAANFLTLLVLTIIREVLSHDPKADKEKPRHVIFLEEAHNLIGPTMVANGENGNTKVASTKYIVDMLAEVRALQESIIIADQLPTSLAPQVTKNTSLKIAHRITAMDDRELLAATMSADGVQLERMAIFIPGHALCIYEDVQKPFELSITTYDGNPESPDNEELLELLKNRAVYRAVMQRDFEIMQQKFALKKAKLINMYETRVEALGILLRNVEVLEKGNPTREDVARVKAGQMQQEREVDKLANLWLEYLLEYMDYVKMNRLQLRTGGQIIKTEYRQFRDLLSQLVEKEKMERLLDRAELGLKALIGK